MVSCEVSVVGEHLHFWQLDPLMSYFSHSPSSCLLPSSAACLSSSLLLSAICLSWPLVFLTWWIHTNLKTRVFKISAGEAIWWCCCLSNNRTRSFFYFLTFELYQAHAFSSTRGGFLRLQSMFWKLSNIYFCLWQLKSLLTAQLAHCKQQLPFSNVTMLLLLEYLGLFNLNCISYS